MNKYLTKIAEMRERKFPKAKAKPKTKLKASNPSKPKNVVQKKDNLIKRSKNGK